MVSCRGLGRARLRPGRLRWGSCKARRWSVCRLPAWFKPETRVDQAPTLCRATRVARSGVESREDGVECSRVQLEWQRLSDAQEVVKPLVDARLSPQPCELVEKRDASVRIVDRWVLSSHRHSARAFL